MSSIDQKTWYHDSCNVPFQLSHNAKERPSRESQANLWLSTKDERSKDSSAYQW
jgi:hypothetical protein